MPNTKIATPASLGSVKLGDGLMIDQNGYLNTKLGSGLVVDSNGLITIDPIYIAGAGVGAGSSSSYVGTSDTLPATGASGTYFIKNVYDYPKYKVSIKTSTGLLDVTDTYGLTTSNTGFFDYVVHCQGDITDTTPVANVINIAYIPTATPHSYDVYIYDVNSIWQLLGTSAAISTSTSSPTIADTFNKGSILHSTTINMDLGLINGLFNLTVGNYYFDTLDLSTLVTSNNSVPTAIGQLVFSDFERTANKSATAGLYVYTDSWVLSSVPYVLPAAGTILKDQIYRPLIGGVYTDYGSTLAIDSDGYAYVKLTYTNFGQDANGNLTLNPATTSTLGGIKVGAGLVIDGYGVLSATGSGGTSSYTLPSASKGTLGGVIVGSGLSVDGYGVLSALGGAVALSNGSGLVLDGYGNLGVKVGAGLSVDGYGYLYATSTGGTTQTVPHASAIEWGIIKIGTGLLVDDYGILSAKNGAGLQLDSFGAVAVKFGAGLAIDTEGTLYATSVSTAPTSNTVISTSTDTQVFNFSGLISPVAGLSRWYPYGDSNLISFYASIEYSPTAPITIQLNKNGVAIGNVITIASGAFKSDVELLSISVTPNDYLTVDIISGDSGANLSAILVSNYTLSGVSNNPIASTSSLGTIKVGDGLNVSSDGTLTVVNKPIVSPIFADNHDFSVYALGVLGNDQLLGMQLASQSFTISGSGYARALIPPTMNAVFLFLVNSVQVGTINFTAGYNIGVLNIPDTFISGGDLLQIVAPHVADPIMANVAITIGGTGAIGYAIPKATATTYGLVKLA